ncbi:MAG: TolC family protein [Desulfobacterales bacterium]
MENALVAYAKEQLRRESLKAAAAAAQRAVLLAQDQYAAGLVDFNNVLIAQRSLLSLQDELARSEGTVTSNLVRLYKALGGGWKFQESTGSEMAVDSDHSRSFGSPR